MVNMYKICMLISSGPMYCPSFLFFVYFKFEVCKCKTLKYCFLERWWLSIKPWSLINWFSIFFCIKMIHMYQSGSLILTNLIYNYRFKCVLMKLNIYDPWHLVISPIFRLQISAVFQNLLQAIKFKVQPSSFTLHNCHD